MASITRSIPLDRHRLLGVTFAVLAALGFSVKAILVKLAYADAVDAVTLLALRMLFSVPFFLAIALWSGANQGTAPLEKRDWLLVLALGLIGYYLSSLLDFLGLQFISAGLERLILFLYPTLVVMLSAILLKRPIQRREVVALCLSYAGVALALAHDISLKQSGILLGASLVFASTLSYSTYLVGAGHAIARIGAVRFTAYAMTVACAASVLQFSLIHPWSALLRSARVYELSFAMAIISTVLPAFLAAASMRRIGSSHAALIGSIGPIATIYLAYVFLGEAFSGLQIAGALLVIAGVLAISVSSKQKKGGA